MVGDFTACACANAECLRYGCVRRRPAPAPLPPAAFNNIFDPDRPWRAMDRLAGAVEKLCAILGDSEPGEKTGRDPSSTPDVSDEVPGSTS